jgi:hypothetical protein
VASSGSGRSVLVDDDRFDVVAERDLHKVALAQADQATGLGALRVAERAQAFAVQQPLDGVAPAQFDEDRRRVVLSLTDDELGRRVRRATSRAIPPRGSGRPRPPTGECGTGSVCTQTRSRDRRNDARARCVRARRRRSKAEATRPTRTRAGFWSDRDFESRSFGRHLTGRGPRNRLHELDSIIIGSVFQLTMAYLLACCFGAKIVLSDVKEALK